MSAAITITSDRLSHMLGTARACQEYSKNLFGWDDEKCEEMFLMGLVHDFAYEFVANQKHHEHAGGEILKRVGFAYSDEVFLHGDPDVESCTEELFILNLADMTTSNTGERCSFDQRLDSVVDRYGKNSVQAEKMRLMIQKIKDTAVDFDITLYPFVLPANN